MSLKLTLNFFGGRSPSWIEEGCDVYLKRLSGSMEIILKEQGSAKVNDNVKAINLLGERVESGRLTKLFKYLAGCVLLFGKSS